MKDALVMTIFGLKSTGDAFVKMIISTAFSTLKTILKTIFGIEIKLLYLTYRCVVKISKAVQSNAVFKYIFPENVDSPEPEVSAEAVVKGVKKIRRALCLSLEEYYGLDVKSDMDLIQERLDEVHKCMEEDDDEKTLEALAKLKELNKPFEDGSWKEKYVKDLEVREYTVDESETEDKPTNMLEEQKFDRNKISSNQESLKSNGLKRTEPDTRQQRPERNNAENITLRNGLEINTKLEKVLKVSSDLLEEIERLNRHVEQLTEVNNSMANLQNQIDDGKKLLSEIEADRNKMKTKFSILEDMIKEEEQFLNDLSYESGYDEGETPNQLKC